MLARSFSVLLLAICLPAGALADAKGDLDALLSDLREFDLGEDPLAAGEEGDLAALARLPAVTPADEARRAAAAQGFADRLAAIPRDGLARHSDRLTHDLLDWELGARLARAPFEEGRVPFVNDSGFHTDLAFLATEAPARTVAEAEAWIARLQDAPRYYAENIANLRRGVATGWTQPRPVAERIAEVARAMVPGADPQESPYFAPLDRMADTIPAADRARLRQAAAAAIDGPVRAATQGLVAFLEAEYLPAARKELGARAMPGGQDWYRALIRRHTTTQMTPDAVQALGQAEVARIRGQMEAAIAETGFAGSFAEFLEFLRTDPQFYAQTPEALLAEAAVIAKSLDGRLPEFFATLPRNTYGVRPVPAALAPNFTTGRYQVGNGAQGRAGAYLVNTTALDQRPLYELPALTAHEAVPGHHLQIALAQELENVPDFRRDYFVTAFTEGWGLYAEALAGEMGAYRTPYEEFGRLSYEMWRACRLVADTGIHWLGWSRDQARACFADNSALSPANIESELDRYISWPGQALAYKIGELKFQELRARAETALGADFDIRRFHDALLLDGALPLSLVEANIDRWIAEQQAAD